MKVGDMGIIVWVNAEDCYAPHGLDFEWPHDRDKVDWLEHEFANNGFDKSKPALIGYPLNNKIQLLSGTHRHEAAKRTNTKLPIVLWLRSDVEKSWGILEKWIRIMEDISVEELETWTREDVEKYSLEKNNGIPMQRLFGLPMLYEDM